MASAVTKKNKMEEQHRLDHNQKNDLEEQKVSPPLTFVVVFSNIMPMCCSFSSGCVIGYSSPAQNGIMSELGLTVAQFSLFGSILTFGGVIGAALCGRITDLAGRKGALWLTDLLYIMGWIFITVSQDAWSLDLGRLIMGVGLGLSSYASPLYIVEITPKNTRGAFAAFSVFMSGCGISATFLIGSLISWRKLAFISLLPCIIEFVCLFFVPESPRWLAKMGRHNESELALQRLRGKNVNIQQEAEKIKNFVENQNQRSKEDGFFDLFQHKYARVMIISVGLMALQQLGGLSGYTFYQSFILESAGFPVKVGAMAASFVQILSTIISITMIDKCGRRPLLLISTTLMFLASFITGASFLLQNYNVWKHVTPSLTLVGVLMFIFSISFGVGGVPWIIVSEIIPLNIKASAASVVNLINWIFNWLVAFSFNFIFAWSSPGVFFIFSTISALGVVFVAKMVPETKGRTLEEIQASITQ